MVSVKEMEGGIGGGRARVEVEEAVDAATLAATMAARRSK
jgi:hypothetical protein